MFRKPTLADIYIDQIRTKLDSGVVPVYEPDTPDIRIGTIGRFEDGRFEVRGHLEDLLGKEQFEADVALGEPSQPSTFTFQSESGVKLEPSAKVSAGGVDLITAKLSFSGERAVVASFADVVEQKVRSPRDFDDLLWRLYLDGRLAQNEVVVFSRRGAGSGTVLVNRKGNVEVEVMADPKVIGPVLSIGSLGLGVQFGAGAQASAQLSGSDLTFTVGVKGLSDDNVIENVRGFDASPDEQLGQLLGTDVPEVTTDDVLGEVDFTAPEE